MANWSSFRMIIGWKSQKTWSSPSIQVKKMDSLYGLTGIEREQVAIMTQTEDWEAPKFEVQIWSLLKSSFWLKQAKSYQAVSRFVAGMTETEGSKI